MGNRHHSIFQTGRIGVTARFTVAACMATFLAATLVLPGPASAARADPVSSTILNDPDVIKEIRDWVDTPVMRISLAAQNTKHQGIDSTRIQELDQLWRAQREEQIQPLIAARLSNPLSNYLSRIQAKYLGLYSEIFVMDNKGLNVGQSSVTSDYWQGDEAKFQKTFNIGPDAVFIDEAEYHAATDTWRAQINLAISDESGKNPIGAVTVEVNLTELKRRLDR